MKRLNNEQVEQMVRELIIYKSLDAAEKQLEGLINEDSDFKTSHYFVNYVSFNE